MIHSMQHAKRNLLPRQGRPYVTPHPATEQRTGNDHVDAPTTAQALYEIITKSESGGGFVALPIELRAITGSGDSSIFLAQLLYWFRPDRKGKRPKVRVRKKGHYWRAASHKEWANELHLQERTIRTCIDRLKKDGLIEWAVFKFSGTPVLHLRPLIDRIWNRVLEHRSGN